MCGATCLTVLAILFALFGGGFFGLGPFVPSLIHSVLVDGLRQQKILTSENSTGFAQYQSSDFPGAPIQYFNAYIWNVTNPEEARTGAKPKLQQIGPFVYEYHWHLFDVEFSSDLNEVSSSRFEMYRLVLNMSIGDPNTTKVTVINVPYAAVRSGIPDPDQWFNALAMDLIASVSETDIFIETTVHSVIFGGVSPLLEWLDTHATPGIATTFGLQFNDTTEQTCRERLNYTKDSIKTGHKNFTEIGQYTMWHNMTNLSVWNTTGDANLMDGTDGTGFQAEMPSDINYTVFVDTLYRKVHFWFNETKDLKGVPTRKYWLDPVSFWNHSLGNYDYNMWGPQGLTNMTAPENVQQGQPVPVFIGLPLFYQADQSYADKFEFTPVLSPARDFYNTELDVEPVTGITVGAKKRVQINVQILNSLMLYPNLNDLMFPIAWFELESSLTDELAAQWKGQVGLALWIMQYGSMIVYSIGGFFVLLCLVFSILAYSRRRTEGYEVVNDDPHPSKIN